MTQFLGFKNYGDEYKVTLGLASYGKPIYFDKIKDNLFINDKKEIIWLLCLDFFNHHIMILDIITGNDLIIDQIYSDKLTNLLKRNQDIENFKKNFCILIIQKIYEYFFKKIINKIMSKNYSNLIPNGWLCSNLLCK